MSVLPGDLQSSWLIQLGPGPFSTTAAPQALRNVQLRPNLSFMPTEVFALVLRTAPPNLGGLTQRFGKGDPYDLGQATCF
jgi:hypothetical protein